MTPKIQNRNDQIRRGMVPEGYRSCLLYTVCQYKRFYRRFKMIVSIDLCFVQNY